MIIIHPHRANSSTGPGTAPWSRQSCSAVSSPRSSERSRCLLTPGQNLSLKSDSSRLLLPERTGLILTLIQHRHHVSGSDFTETGVGPGSVQQLVSDCLSGVQ